MPSQPKARKSTRPASKLALKAVTTNLFTVDIRELKRRAAQDRERTGFGKWQIKLRLLVHNALKSKGELE